jgi:NTP pyrophosphatase (non-canonical NTP hydrolase)
MLGIRDLQAFHVILDREKAFDLDLFRNIAYLVGELGEVVHAARQFKRAEGTLERAETQDHLGEELADCLAYLLKLANYAGIDLQAAYVKKMRRNVTRTWPQRPHETA